MKKITVLLSDDHMMVRQGLRALLEATEDILVIGEAQNGHDSVRETKRLQPDVVLLDVAMPLLNGVGAARQILKEAPSTKVLILSAYRDERHVQGAIEAGASGYLIKEAAANDLLRAIREVQKGNFFFSPLVTTGLLKGLRKTLSNDDRATKEVRLTNRETEVLQLIAEGNSNKEIAGLLFISKKTVEKHRLTLMKKLDIHEIATLTRYAIANGIVESSHAAFMPVRFAPALKSVNGAFAPSIRTQLPPA